MRLKLKYWRKMSRMTLQELEAKTGFDYTQISKWERGEQQPKTGQLEILARALRVSPRDLLNDRPPVPVVGYIGAGHQVFGIDDHPPGEGLYKVACPEGLDPTTAVGLEVRGSSMLPIQDGWVIFYDRHAATPADVLGRLCAVKTADGAYFVKIVYRAPQLGRFNLLSTNAAPIENVELEWAAPIDVALPPERLERIEVAAAAAE